MTNQEHLSQPEAIAATPEALKVYHDTLPLAVELSILSVDESELRDQLYQPGGVMRTPLTQSRRPLVEGATVLLKDEGLQSVGSYKIRGALASMQTALATHSDVRRVVTYSAGNHARGTVAAAQLLGVDEVVLETFRTISAAKEVPLAQPGVLLRKDHDNLTQARDAAHRHGERSDTVVIEPFDAVETIAGQSTIMSEIFEDLLTRHHAGELDLMRDEIVLTVPAGGGGCAAGMAVMLYALKQQGYMGNNVTLRAIQMEGCAALADLQTGKNVTSVDASCDGTAVYEPGELTRAVLFDPAFVDEIVVVPKSYVGEAMMKLERELGHPVEPAGALSLAGAQLLQERDTEHRTYVSLVSGANVTLQTANHFKATLYAARQVQAALARTAFKQLSDAYIASANHAGKVRLSTDSSRMAARAGGLAVASGYYQFKR
jgi:threonine dehydratase